MGSIKSSEHTELGELLAQIPEPEKPTEEQDGFEVKDSTGKTVRLNESPLTSNLMNKKF